MLINLLHFQWIVMNAPSGGFLWTRQWNQYYIHEEVKECFKLGQCLLPFRSEYSVFPSPTWNSKNWTRQHIISLALSYGCETSLHTVREEYRMMVFEKRVLKRKFELNRVVIWYWRKLHNKKHRHLHSSPNIIREHVKENEKGGIFETNKRDEKCTQTSSRKTCSEVTASKTYA